MQKETLDAWWRAASRLCFTNRLRTLECMQRRAINIVADEASWIGARSRDRNVVGRRRQGLVHGVHQGRHIQACCQRRSDGTRIYYWYSVGCVPLLIWYTKCGIVVSTPFQLEGPASGVHSQVQHNRRLEGLQYLTNVLDLIPCCLRRCFNNPGFRTMGCIVERSRCLCFGPLYGNQDC